MFFNDEEIEDDKLTVLSENARGHFLVRYDMGFSCETFVQIDEYVAGSTGQFALDPCTWQVDLPPREALLLLDWLLQEKETLEKLVTDELERT